MGLMDDEAYKFAVPLQAGERVVGPCPGFVDRVVKREEPYQATLGLVPCRCVSPSVHGQ